MSVFMRLLGSLCLQNRWQLLIPKFANDGVFQQSPQPFPILLDPAIPILGYICESNAMDCERFDKLSRLAGKYSHGTLADFLGLGCEAERHIKIHHGSAV